MSGVAGKPNPLGAEGAGGSEGVAGSDGVAGREGPVGRTVGPEPLGVVTAGLLEASVVAGWEKSDGPVFFSKGAFASSDLVNPGSLLANVSTGVSCVATSTLSAESGRG